MKRFRKSTSRISAMSNRSLHRARGAREPSLRLVRRAPEDGRGGPRRTLDELWSRMEARMARREEEGASEREAALSLMALLDCLPTGQQLETVESEPRFWTLGLVETLLAAASSAQGSSLHSVGAGARAWCGGSIRNVTASR